MPHVLLAGSLTAEVGAFTFNGSFAGNLPDNLLGLTGLAFLGAVFGVGIYTSGVYVGDELVGRWKGLYDDILIHLRTLNALTFRWESCQFEIHGPLHPGGPPTRPWVCHPYF